MSLRLTTLVVALTLLLAGTASAASTRPDLTISIGKITARSGVVSGAVAVANIGHSTAAASSVSLVVKVGRFDRVLLRLPVASVKRGKSRTVKVKAFVVPASLPAGSYTITACADGAKKLRERSETNNCLKVGTFRVAARPSPGVVPVAVDPGTIVVNPLAPVVPPSRPAPVDPDAPVLPGCSTPACNPVAVPTRTPFAISDALGTYWAFVGDDYDQTNHTPAGLLVWLHGCGGHSVDVLGTVGDYYGGPAYIAIAPDGAEGGDGCWDMSTGPRRVLTAIADAETRFDIDPRRVVIGGYSSGGDLAYRTAFFHASTFAGLLAINTAPFRDTGKTQAEALAAATWHFPIVHVAHTGDTTYPLADVDPEIQAVQDAGFPVTYEKRPGMHYDDPPTSAGDPPSTDEEIQTQLIAAYRADAWQSPPG